MKKKLMVLALAMTALLGVLPPRAVYAQTAADLSVELTDDGSGVRIKGYTGKGGAVRIPGTIEGLPVKEIGEGAFGASNITSVNLPTGLTSIGALAFSACPELTQVVIPDSVTTIGHRAFGSSFTGPGQRTRQKTGLTSVRLPQNLTILGNGAFSECSSLASVTFTGTTLTEIPDNAFEGTALKTIVIPDVITTIGERAFSNCKNLTSVTLGRGITTIKESAFSSCSALTTVTIPDSVAAIEFSGGLYDDSFFNCPRLGIAAQAAIKKRGYTGSF